MHVFKHALDTRYTHTSLATHDRRELPGRSRRRCRCDRPPRTRPRRRRHRRSAFLRLADRRPGRDRSAIAAAWCSSAGIDFDTWGQSFPWLDRLKDRSPTASRCSKRPVHGMRRRRALLAAHHTVGRRQYRRRPGRLRTALPQVLSARSAIHRRQLTTTPSKFALPAFLKTFASSPRGRANWRVRGSAGASPTRCAPNTHVASHKPGSRISIEPDCTEFATLIRIECFAASGFRQPLASLRARKSGGETTLDPPRDVRARNDVGDEV